MGMINSLKDKLGFFINDKMVAPDVVVVEKDFSVVPIGLDAKDTAIIGEASTGPMNAAISLIPKIKPIKWYQFWRWYLIGARKKECKEMQDKFLDLFGEPG